MRSLYFLALPQQQVRASMIRTRDFKYVQYHGHAPGELFDLKKDPGEFDNLWNDPAYADVRFTLARQAFDCMASAADTGPKRVAPW